MEVQVHHDGTSRAIPIQGQLSIGRSPENDVVLPSPKVSWNHAVAWMAGPRVLVQDLGSRHGTWLDGERVVGVVPWEIGALLCIEDVRIALAHSDSPPHGTEVRWMAIEDVATGVRIPLRRAQVLIGAGPMVDLRIGDGDGPPAVLISHANGEVWLGQDDEDRLLSAGETFTVAGAQLKLVAADDGWRPTSSGDDDAHPYSLDVVLTAQHAAAHFTNLQDGTEVTIRAPNRVSLLYFLADALKRDREARLIEIGWRPDISASMAIWGKSSYDPRRLKGLIHNLRGELRAGGLDPWCLEKRRGHVRLRVHSTQVQC